MKLFNILMLCLFLLICGCSNKQPQSCLPIIKTEYVEVKVPVVYKLKRPTRPKFDKSTPIPVYVKELTTYTETLEIIIDGTKK